MAFVNDDDSQFYEIQTANLQGIRALLLLIGYSLQNQPGEHATTYLAEKLAQSICTLEHWYRQKTKACVLVGIVLALYSCATSWSMEWHIVVETLGSALGAEGDVL